jgi:hypothetical protein
MTPGRTPLKREVFPGVRTGPSYRTGIEPIEGREVIQ